MTHDPLRQIVVGGGLAGWLTALVLARALGGSGISVTVAEGGGDDAADALYSVTDDEAPAFLEAHGITERLLFARCRAGYSLGVRIDGLKDIPFGGIGHDWHGVPFVQHMTASRETLEAEDVLAFSPGALAMQDGRFAPKDVRNRIGSLQHGVGLHLDPAALKAVCRELALAAGVEAAVGVDRQAFRIETTPLRPVPSRVAQAAPRPFTALNSDCSLVRAFLNDGSALDIEATRSLPEEDPWADGVLRVGPAAGAAPMEIHGPWRLLLRELEWLIGLLPPDHRGDVEGRAYNRLYGKGRQELLAMSDWLRHGRGDAALFEKRGYIPSTDNEIFDRRDWIKAFLARNRVPRLPDPMACRFPASRVSHQIDRLRAEIDRVEREFPPYSAYLQALQGVVP